MARKKKGPKLKPVGTGDRTAEQLISDETTKNSGFAALSGKQPKFDNGARPGPGDIQGEIARQQEAVKLINKQKSGKKLSPGQSSAVSSAKDRAKKRSYN